MGACPHKENSKKNLSVFAQVRGLGGLPPIISKINRPPYDPQIDRLVDKLRMDARRRRMLSKYSARRKARATIANL